MATTTVDSSAGAGAAEAGPAPSASQQSPAPAPLFHDFMGMARMPPAPLLLPENRQRSPPDAADGETSVKSSPAACNDTTTSVCSAPARLAGLPDPSCSSRDSDRASMGSKNRVLQSHGNKSAFHRPEVDGGRSISSSCLKKRDAYVCSDHQRLQLNTDPTENTRSPKMSKFEGLDANKVAAEEILMAMQRPGSACPTTVLQASSKPESIAAAAKRWESPSLYGPSRLGKIGALDDKMPMNVSMQVAVPSSADNVGMPSFSRPAADEGSRTGLQGTSLASLVANGGGGGGAAGGGGWPSSSKSSAAAAPPAASGLLPSRSHLWFQGAASSDSTLPSGRQIGPPTSSQLTIFYGGHAHVFDDVSPDKADAIIALAGSSGRSWSTTYSPQARSSMQPSSIPSFVGPSNT